MNVMLTRPGLTGDTSAADSQQMGPPQAPEDPEGNGGATVYSICMEFDKSIKEFTETEIIGPGFNSGKFPCKILP